MNKSTKQKSKESKNNINAKRQYELEAISTMLETINVNEKNFKVAQETQSKVTKEASEVAEKLQAEARTWMKVTDKKDQKKRQLADHSHKVNDILKKEDTPKVEYVPLTKVSGESTVSKTSEKFLAQELPKVTPKKGYSLNLAEFTTPPSREKLSQKQRKRLSSEPTTSWRASATPDSKPVNVSVLPQNAWGVVTQASPSAYSVSPPTGSIADPSSFANMMRGGVSTVSNSNPSNVDNSFSRILADERKQRDYYERMRNKSLALTQIEELAIAELREFYNVDNVTDEEITIERKSLPTTMNFAVWQRH